MSTLLTVKELAFELRKNASYVYAMRARGFKMPAGLATLNQALKWLDKHPSPRGKLPKCDKPENN